MHLELVKYDLSFRRNHTRSLDLTHYGVDLTQSSMAGAVAAAPLRCTAPCATSVFARRVRQIVLALLSCVAAQAPATAFGGWEGVGTGSVVLFRHALAPGGGDPDGFKLEDCRTQRNLSAEGRAQAHRLGAAFAQRGIAVGAVWSSQWCRTRDTADLAFPGKRVDQPVFNSFFNTPELSASATRQAQQLLSAWRGPGVLVVVTHQVNITALTGVVPSSGEGVVVKPSTAGLQTVGRITP